MTLGKLLIHVRNVGDFSLENMANHPSLTLLCSEVELTSIVDKYGGMMSDCSTMINQGDYVQYCDSNSPMVNWSCIVFTQSYCNLI